MTETCGNCRFRGTPYGHADAYVYMINDHFQCRRHAPIVTGGLHSQISTEWAAVKNNYWCGEWEPKQEATDNE